MALPEGLGCLPVIVENVIFPTSSNMSNAKKNKAPGGCFRVSILAIKMLPTPVMWGFFSVEIRISIGHNPNHGMVSMHLARDWDRAR